LSGEPASGPEQGDAAASPLPERGDDQGLSARSAGSEPAAEAPSAEDAGAPPSEAVAEPGGEGGRSILGDIVEYGVYAPLGAAVRVAENLPNLLGKGMERVEKRISTARVVGRFAVTHARRRVGDTISAAAASMGSDQASHDEAGDRRPAPGTGSPGAEEAASTATRAPEIERSGEVTWVFEEDGRYHGVQVAPSPTSEGLDLTGSAATTSAPPGPSGASEAPLAEAPVAEPRAAETGRTETGRTETGRTETGRTETGPMETGLAGSGPTGQGSASPDPTTSRSAPTSGTTSAPPPVEGLAIPNYDSLAASQVVPRLASLSPPELESVRRYEAANRRRMTVLNRVAQLQDAASGGERSEP